MQYFDMLYRYEKKCVENFFLMAPSTQTQQVTSSAYSKRVKLWVVDYLPSFLKLAEYPNPATVGKTYKVIKK